MHGTVETAPCDVPPDDASPGQMWIVGAAPTGAWLGQAGALAWWTEGGWRFAAAREGMAVWIRDATCSAVRTAGGWSIGTVCGTDFAVAGVRVVGAQKAAIADPGGGAMVDAEARASLVAVLAALRDHGLIAT